jgi:hypothetical protein
MKNIASLINPNTDKVVKTLYINATYKESEDIVKQLNEKLSEKTNKKELYWTITGINI